MQQAQAGSETVVTCDNPFSSPTCWRVRAEALELRLPVDAAAAPPSEQLQLTARAPPASLQLLSTSAGDHKCATKRQCGELILLGAGPSMAWAA